MYAGLRERLGRWGGFNAKAERRKAGGAGAGVWGKAAGAAGVDAPTNAGGQPDLAGCGEQTTVDAGIDPTPR